MDGDEDDGYDEVIYPVDFRVAGHIVDDEMHRIMVKPLQPGVRLTAIFDSCHSGSILDLPYLYHSNGRVKGSDVTAAFKKKRATPADVITWSGSADSQTSADTVQNGLAVGAMSHAFISALREERAHTFESLFLAIHDEIRSHPIFTQKPQLSSSHSIVSLHYLIGLMCGVLISLQRAVGLYVLPQQACSSLLTSLFRYSSGTAAQTGLVQASTATFSPVSPNFRVCSASNTASHRVHLCPS